LNVFYQSIGYGMGKIKCVSVLCFFIGAQTATASERSVWHGVDPAIVFGFKKHRNRDYNWHNLNQINEGYTAYVRTRQEQEDHLGRPIGDVTRHAELCAAQRNLLAQALHDEKKFEGQRNSMFAGSVVAGFCLSHFLQIYKLR
jgi:hypothetical protein